MGITRRTFLQVAAGTGAAGFGGLNKVLNKLIPYVNPPEDIRPAVWARYATTCRECPAGCGLQMRTVDGRPIKAEGNPEHPVNRGGLCARGQSGVQGLYDPDRLRTVLHRAAAGGPGTPDQWPAALEAIGRRLRAAPPGRVAILSDLQTGAFADLLTSFARAFGSERVLFYEPLHYAPLRGAHETVFGLPQIPEYRLAGCNLVLSLAADFLETWISPVQFAGGFTEAHAYRDGKIGRLVYAGPRLSLTAANADEYISLAPGAERWLGWALLHAIVTRGWARADMQSVAPALDALRPEDLAVPGLSAARIELLAREFVESPGSVALAGPAGATGEVATETAAVAALLNYAAGRLGQTVDFARPHALSRCAAPADVDRFLATLTPEDTLIIHRANPAYAWPGSPEGLRRAGAVVCLNTMADETCAHAEWVLPIDSPLEAWGDYEPYAGVHALQQPTVRRLFDSRPAGDVLLTLAAQAGKPLGPVDAAGGAGDFAGWLRERWATIHARVAPARPFQEFWEDALRRGGVWEEAPAVTPKLAAAVGQIRPVRSNSDLAAGSVELWLWPSLLLFDGAVANRGWLQETPDPTSGIDWGSWADVHPENAATLGLRTGDVIELRTAQGHVEVSVRVTADVVRGTAALAFGQGHTALGRIAAGRGANGFALLGLTSDPGAAGVMFGTAAVRKTGRRAEPVEAYATQDQHGREVLQWVPLAKLRTMQPGDGDALVMPLPEGYDPAHDVYGKREYKKHRWAMVVDLQRCIGCSACTVACYAENNVPVVGEEQVRRSRIMSWLRVVPYRHPEEERRLGFLPLLCHQCDAAPCEPVCPVFAAVHNDEGLNAQVYNRCIGTRYCSNNCPYKVRRFNWINIRWEPPLDMQLNPEVTVRSRGVMEKCTFCIQRIREVEWRARRENRPVRDGEIKPACAESCPTRAIVFGDLLDAESEVTRLTRRDPRRYHLLEELNTKPALTYLRRIRAPEA